ncbi:MAG: helix-turn-helix transcriptional regulator [Pseudomonadota bacterium]
MTIQKPISPALTAFGAAIKAERIEREWSLTTLADKVLGNADRKGYCSQVEKGLRNLSEGTIRNFARALDLPATVIDPLTGHYLPQDDDTTQEDATASAMLKEAEALREKLKLSEALAVAMAYKYADGNPTDIEGALKGLESALELAAKEQERGRLPSNYEQAGDTVVARINALNQEGEVDQAYADLQAEAARRAEARAQQTAEDGRILDMLITQATLANDADGLAEAHLQRIRLESPSAEDSFHRLRALCVERYRDGLRFGTPFALVAAAGLARKCATIAPTPDLHATAQNDLATMLANQGTRTQGPEGAAFFGEAVESYRAALRVFTEAEHPVDWSTTMQNLAIVLQEQGTRTQGPEGAALLGEAVDSYRAALRVRTEADHPVDWAGTVQNLAIALKQQGTRTQGPEGAALMGEAVGSYRAALRVRTEADHPVQWARTMQNLAIAQQKQGTRTQGPEGAALLSEALDAYRAALRVRTEADHPVDWAMTRANMASLENARAAHDATPDPRPHLEAGLDHAAAALRVFDPENTAFFYDFTIKVRNDLQAALDALPSSSS